MFYTIWALCDVVNVLLRGGVREECGVAVERIGNWDIGKRERTKKKAEMEAKEISEHSLGIN